MDKLEDKSSTKPNKAIKIISNQIDHHICPICLNLLTNPIITPCKHAYCLNCFEECKELLIKNECPL